jgi:hypothetical protein
MVGPNLSKNGIVLIILCHSHHRRMILLEHNLIVSVYQYRKINKNIFTQSKRHYYQLKSYFSYQIPEFLNLSLISHALSHLIKYMSINNYLEISGS